MIDVLLAFPGILLALAIVSVLGPGLTNVMIAVGIAAVPTTRGSCAAACSSARENPYVEAARAVGGRDLAHHRRHILPNVVAPADRDRHPRHRHRDPLGGRARLPRPRRQPPTPEWGRMLSEGRDYLREAWWITTFPGLAIMLTVLAINLLGDGLRDALDPRLRA